MIYSVYRRLCLQMSALANRWTSYFLEGFIYLTTMCFSQEESVNGKWWLQSVILTMTVCTQCLAHFHGKGNKLILSISQFSISRKFQWTILDAHKFASFTVPLKVNTVVVPTCRTVEWQTKNRMCVEYLHKVVIIWSQHEALQIP